MFHVRLFPHLHSPLVSVGSGGSSKPRICAKVTITLRSWWCCFWPCSEQPPPPPPPRPSPSQELLSSVATASSRPSRCLAWQHTEQTLRPLFLALLLFPLLLAMPSWVPLSVEQDKQVQAVESPPVRPMTVAGVMEALLAFSSDCLPFATSPLPRLLLVSLLSVPLPPTTTTARGC